METHTGPTTHWVEAGFGSIFELVLSLSVCVCVCVCGWGGGGGG